MFGGFNSPNTLCLIFKKKEVQEGVLPLLVGLEATPQKWLQSYTMVKPTGLQLDLAAGGEAHVDPLSTRERCVVGLVPTMASPGQ